MRRWAAARPRDRHTRALRLGMIDLEARPGPAATHRHRGLALPPPINFACNSPTTLSNYEFVVLEFQRFQTLLKLHPIELHATFA